MINVFFICGIVLFFTLNFIQEKKFKKQNLETIGTPPIPKAWFAAGKITMILVWLSALLQSLGLNIRMLSLTLATEIVAVVIFYFGLVVIANAYYFLGTANKMGLATEKTELKKKGIYQWSRNPLYLGLALMNIGAMLYAINIVNAILAVIAIVIHHKIILAEEVFLTKRFGQEYQDYQQKVRRYF